ncbi:MAG: GNAT family N-acetyltransferase [Methanomassiliicoccaceae archaeon]|nr:GNAT family N-acetyltransferase [Methanomassiliicoccaceae archaeon]
MMYVRQMTVSDIDRAFEIACLSLEERYLKEVFHFFISGWPGGQLVAVDDVGHVIGFLSGARLTPDKATVPLFAVDHRYRGKGIGSRLMEEFRLRASIDGKQYIQLEVKGTSAAAISFYKKAGFTPIAYLEGFYQDGTDGVRMLRSVRGDS